MPSFGTCLTRPDARPEGGAPLALALRSANVGPESGTYSESAVSNWIKGRARPPADVVLAAASLYGISLDTRLGVEPAAARSDPEASTSCAVLCTVSKPWCTSAWHHRASNPCSRRGMFAACSRPAPRLSRLCRYCGPSHPQSMSTPWASASTLSARPSLT